MRRLSLPLSPTQRVAPEPTPETVRLRLGGRGQSEAGAGMVVRFVEAPGAGTLGVVLYRSGDVLDVYLGDGWLRRTNRSAVAALEIEPPASLAAAAADARMFTELREGDRVRYRAANGQVVLGELLEKCRYGAIVQNDDRRLVGIGFRKLWPVPDGEPA